MDSKYQEQNSKIQSYGVSDKQGEQCMVKIETAGEFSQYKHCKRYVVAHKNRKIMPNLFFLKGSQSENPTWRFWSLR